ncbi:MAG: NAD(P)/FAD-dependent oxidoreductase [Solirubrobacterales bacterium]
MSASATAAVEEHVNGGAGRVHDVAVIGTGFSGLGMSIKLKRSGVEDFVVLERASSVGGTWRDNTYPGIQCDVPSHLYSLSFAPNPDWSRAFSPGPEIWEYLKRTADEQGITPHIRFDSEVTEARWDAERRNWVLQTATGVVRARVLVAGLGGLVEPRLPDVPGIEDFPGEVMHSARWDHDYDFRGKRVAVIGTGASSIQIVPQLQPIVAELDLFQRTPAWIAPRRDHAISARRRRLYKRFPVLQKLTRQWIFWTREVMVLGLVKRPQLLGIVERAARAHLNKQVSDPDLRRKLTPDYTIGCKRILISNDFYPALTQPNVDVVPEGMTEVRGNRVVGSDGTEREVDAIVLGTGFQVTDFPGAKVIYGRDGDRSLSEIWQGSPKANRCTTVAGFPNLFVLGGPNDGIGHTSAVEMIEHQFTYVLDALATMRREGLAAVDVRPEVQERFVADLDRKMEDTVWLQGGCASWYLDSQGRNSTLWPDWTAAHARATEHFDLTEYEVERVGEPERELTPA